MSRVERARIRRADRQVLLACSVGACLAALLFFWMLTAGSMNPFERTVIDAPITKFNEAQARSLLDGHFDVPVSALGGEAIYPDAPVGKFYGKTYGYYGPAPALLRIPVLLFTSDKYPYLAPFYFMAAFALEACALVALLMLVKQRAAPSVTPHWEPFAYGAFTFTVLGGSVFLLLASRPLVYEEAILWGNACALAALYSVVRFLLRPGWRWLAIAAVFCSVALLARVSLGMGPVLALLAIGTLALAGRVSKGIGRVEGSLALAAPKISRSLAVGALVGAVVPVGIFFAVNYAKFGTLTSIPLDHQWFVGGNPGRRHLVESLGGEFAPKYVPVNFWGYFRPDALRFTSGFPWVNFPPPITPTLHLPVLGTVIYDYPAGTASVISMMPALFVLAVIGTWAAFRPIRNTARLAAFRIVLVAAIASTAGALALFGQQPRYLADFLPWLVVGGGIGLAHFLAWQPRRSSVRRLSAAGLVVLAMFGCYVSFGLTMVTQRVTSVEIKPSLKQRYLEWQRDLPHVG